MLELNFMGGSIQNYLKMAELTQKFELKKTQGTLSFNEEELIEKQKEIKQLEKQAADIRKSNKIASIDSKLKAGGVPTDQELKYLKSNDYTLYTKAVAVLEERKAYRKSLHNAKTKDEVSRINNLKLQQFTTELSAAKGDFEKTEQIGRRFMGVMSEHTQFVGSERYSKLPTDKEYYSGKKKVPVTTYDSDRLPVFIFSQINKQLNEDHEDSEVHSVDITV